MTIDFYHMLASPPCITVELVARQIGVELNRIEKNIGKGEHRAPEFTKINPMHKLPTLVDDGVVIWESRAIVTYLVNKYAPGHALYPADPAKRARIDMWLHFDNGTLDAGQRLFYSTLFVDRKPLNSKPEREVPFKNALATLDAHLARSKFVAGEGFTLADMSLLGTLAFAEGFEYDISGYANIGRWTTEAKQQLPFYEEFAGPAVAQLKGFVGGLKAAFAKA